MDRGAWRATVHGVTKSRTQLKQLSMHAHALPHQGMQSPLPQEKAFPHPHEDTTGASVVPNAKCICGAIP